MKTFGTFKNIGFLEKGKNVAPRVYLLNAWILPQYSGNIVIIV